MEENEIKEQFVGLYESTYDKAYRYAAVKTGSPDAAEDILQEIYLKIYRLMLSGGRIRDPKHYVMRAVKRAAADYYSAKAVTESIEETEIVDEAALRQLENDDGYLFDEVMRRIRDFDENTYRIFLLHFKYGLTLKAAAKELDLAESTVKSKLYRGLRRIKETTGKEGGQYESI
ncbi:MAG: sigma-70 family RNA polymerase sigma factor [Ruminococcus sp.]|nr:sigma-70 family RNA polymerase sigma factor [Ruminococcus sp.]